MSSTNKYIFETKEKSSIQKQVLEEIEKEIEAFYYSEPVLQSTVWNFLSYYKDRLSNSKVDKKSKSDIAWNYIQEEFDLTKSGVSKILKPFIPENFKRHIILRDIGNAYALVTLGFHKEAVIITGGVIEEILRLYINVNYDSNLKSFYELLRFCSMNNLFNNSIQNLNDSVREFRNLVHIKKESDKSCSINKSNAKGAIASIFSFISAIKEYN